MKKINIKSILNTALVIFILTMLTHPYFITYANINENHGTGWIEPSQEDLNEINEIISSSPRVNLPKMVDLSNDVPKPGNQGSQGSCVAWAVGYALKSQQEQIERNWGVNSPNHQFSPAYIYNQINGGYDNGSNIANAMKLIRDHGVCTLTDMPYNQYDYKTQPTDYQRSIASKFKALSYDYISNGNVEEFKNQLYNKNPIIIGNIEMYNDFENINKYNPVYDVKDYLLRDGTHAVCLVGYDDDLNAFKFINSWGTNWGINGYGYISYDMIRNDRLNGYILNDKIDVTNISLNKTSINLGLSESENLIASISPSNASIKNVTWTSSNPNVATVSSTGKVTAISYGDTIISVKTNDPDSDANIETCKVTITKPIEPPTINDIQITYSQFTNSITVKAFGVSSVNGVGLVQVGAWHSNDNVSTVKWYNDFTGSGDTYTLIIPLSDFSNRDGMYFINVNTADLLGNSGFILQKTINIVKDVSPPTIDDIEITYSELTNNITVKAFGVSDPNGVSFVQTGVWHSNDSVSSAKWYKDSSGSGDTYTILIPLDDFSNREGIYYINVHAVDKLGNSGIIFKEKIDIKKDINPPTIDDIKITYSELTKTITVKAFGVSDPNGVSFVQTGVWHSNDSVSSAKWYTDSSGSGDTYTILIPLDDFSNREGIYYINVHAVDKLGNSGIIFKEKIDIKKDIDPPTIDTVNITYSELTNNITVKAIGVADPNGVGLVQVGIWHSNDSVSTVKWYNDFTGSGDTYTLVIPLSDFSNRNGMYFVNINTADLLGNSGFIVQKTINVSNNDSSLSIDNNSDISITDDLIEDANIDEDYENIIDNNIENVADNIFIDDLMSIKINNI